MSDNIKVVVKVRPLISREIEEKLTYQWRVKNNTLHQLDQNGREFGSYFTFDKVYDENTKTCDIYNDIAKPIVEAATAGFNGTIFAYGQTSSGKTFTMTGTDESPGIIPLAVSNLFKIIKKVPDRDFLVRVSYIEIYNEKLKDLLNVEKKIKIQEGFQGPKVDCTENVTTSPEEILKYLKEGEANRQTGATNMNEESSRSHSIFQITIESRDHIEGEEEAGCVNVSQLNLVDLAGSERAGQTGATGLRFLEGTHINKSLSSLALVIKQLSEDPNRHVNYRDSKLTRILQNSLGGNAKTSIICAITPAVVEETISTLQFANRAKAIKNKPEVNAVATDATMIQSLTKQLSKLQSQLESKKNLEVMLESKKNVEHNLQKQIAALQRLILNGFGSRSSMDMMAGSRRKLVPPRRVTISTLHPIDEDPVPSVPKFHTPLLKYNPMLVPNSTDFVPIQNANKLSTLTEEGENRLKTPPPQNKKTNNDNEIIELDSDDDNETLDVQTCSPYHKCYGSSKTPPCVLRKNAKLAEKNLKDIVELTDREKIYTPNVVELIEKLEQNTCVMARLEDEVNSLNRKSKEKDLEIDQLRVKVSKSNEEMKLINSAKEELEKLCQEYTTKLTDWEVSYETLKTKTKRREDELLSLLEEHKFQKHAEDISKLSEKPLDKEPNFMDMSKDISLVNSDNESSITYSNDNETAQQDLFMDIQNQLASKNQSVLDLESDILAQKQKILSLEHSSHDLQKIIDDFREKVNLLENENSFLKSTVDTLNSTIKSQKSSLESATSDIISYNSLIQELQIKLTDKEKTPNLLTENTLEKMIANEEKFIANNENMKNIIHSFKIALESRNKEIESLKSAVENNTFSPDNNSVQEQLILKEKEIQVLNEKTKDLQDQINENINLVDKLVQEKNTLKLVEHKLNSELTTITDQFKQLEKNYKEKDTQIASLKLNIEDLMHSITEKDNIEKDLLKKNQVMQQNEEALNQKILDLQDIVNVKDNLIISLNAQDNISQEYIYDANSFLNVLHNFTSTLNGNTANPPNCSDNLNDILNSIKENFRLLESTVLEIIKQKDSEIQKYIKLSSTLELSNKNLTTEINNLQSNIKECQNTILDHDLLREELNTLIEDLRTESESKTSEIIVLKRNMTDLDKRNENLKEEILSKNNMLSSLKENEKTLCSEIDKLKEESLQISDSFRQQITHLTNEFNDKEKHHNSLLIEKDAKIEHLDTTIKEIEQMFSDKSAELESLRDKYKDSNENVILLERKILQHILDLSSSLNIEIEVDSDALEHDKILTVLNKITTYVKSKNICENENIDQILLKTQETMKELGEKNHHLSRDVTELDLKNKSLLSQMDQINLENKSLNEALSQSNDVLVTLRTELNKKSNEIENMVTKTQEIKDHFDGLDMIMKKQIKDLQADNDKLTVRCSELEIHLKDSINNIDSQNTEYIDRDVACDSITSKKSVTDLVSTIENNSPPSLLTICCNKIVDTIQPNEKCSTPSDSNTSLDQSRKCNCDTLLIDLRLVENENRKLLDVVDHLKNVNQRLIYEQEQIRHEVQLLLEPAYELQKKVNSHKTNLSTLTATTYAENKSLRSQVKVLQHHHSRFHKVCQRDLPVVKKQLYDLMMILKGENLYSDKHNISFKRYSLPSGLLENNSTLNHLKNESTLDGDLLMLDTNLTLTTSADNTLMGLDQTCLELTQVYSNNDVACQTNELTYEETLSDNNKKMIERIENLEAENEQLRQTINTEIVITPSVDAQSSPHKKLDKAKELSVCEECEELKQKQQALEEKIKLISQQLCTIESEKDEIEKKYTNLTLEIPSTNALLKRISIFEKELTGRVQEVTKLTHMLSDKNQELKLLQQENDTLSTQVFENISEMDELNRDLDILKDTNVKLTEKCCDLEQLLIEAKSADKNSIVDSVEVHSKLNRSLSDSDTSSRYNKICTLQNELHAGREDCKELSEEVTVIKNHLERSNLSMGQNMDLDDSMGESNIFSFTKHFDNVGSQLNKLSSSNINQERQLDVYDLEKVDCINYFVEKTGADNENFDCNIKIIDILKMFYTKFVMKHNNEVENLVNKIKCYEESRNQLEAHVNELSTEYTKVTGKLEEKEQYLQKFTSTLLKIKQNTTLISEEISIPKANTDELLNVFRQKLLTVIDNEFEITSVSLFDKLIDNIVSQHQNDLSNVIRECTKLQTDVVGLTAQLNAVNDNMLQMKSQLSNKENEYNLLKAQKEKIHEISNAVTLDIVKKEQELCETIKKGCEKLVENNIMCSSEIDLTLPMNRNISILFDRLIMELNKIAPEKEKLTLEIKESKTELEENQKTLDALKVENEKLKDINRTVTLDLKDKDDKLQIQNSVHEELNRRYDSLVEENKSINALVEKRSQEIVLLKESLHEKESSLHNMESNKNDLMKKEANLSELVNTISIYKDEIENLKRINQLIIKEKETTASELEKSKDLLQTNTTELDKMTADILVLRESVKENVSMIETLKLEAKSLLQENIKLKEQLDEKCRDCYRLEMNIKTHEKTAEIQSKMIMRHQKQKEEDDNIILEKNQLLEKLTQQISELEKASEILKSDIKTTREELDEMKKAKEALEFRLSEANVDLERMNKARMTIDATTDSTRRRRQSIQDSNRMFSDNQDFADHTKAEAVFDSRAKPIDLFMDVDEDVVHSNRSTPHRHSRGRDSLSRHDQSDEPLSRPSSVAETRRRRQSIHDMHRTGVQQTPSPHERPSSKLSDSVNRKSADIDYNTQSEMNLLREKLSACQQELEELKEQYRELDDECETCAQHLRERDDQCSRLRKEKLALQNVVAELKEKLQTINPNRSQQEPKVTLCHAAVNTDEDWANLHSVVVDRMSFDAEVDKNKRLTKTIEDLRFKKLELKMTLAKMQKHLEKNAVRDYSKELEITKSELKSCKLELKELQERYKELDEECETCSAYLKERDEQCCKLKKEKAALEAKLAELGDGSRHVSLRKKRQSAHDQLRDADAVCADAATQISDDFLSNQVERDDNSRKRNDEKAKELRYLKSAVEKLSQQKAALELQLAATPSAPLYVATGSAIVQNQQLTDVMKENQKLKKINTKLIEICKKRGKKPEVTIEDISEPRLGQEK